MISLHALRGSHYQQTEMLLFLLQSFSSFSRRNGYSLLTLLFPFPAHTFHPAFGAKYLIEEIEISSEIFPGDPQHCQFKEALPYKALPRAMSQNPASAAPAEIPVLRGLVDAKAEVVTYCVLINPPSGCSQLCPGSTSFLKKDQTITEVRNPAELVLRHCWDTSDAPIKISQPLYSKSALSLCPPTLLQENTTQSHFLKCWLPSCLL